MRKKRRRRRKKKKEEEEEEEEEGEEEEELKAFAMIKKMNHSISLPHLVPRHVKLLTITE